MAKALDAALELFSIHGFRATSMREIADRAELSVGNLYHHFSGKEDLFQRLLDAYWERLLDPELRLNRLLAKTSFPDDLEEMAAAVAEVVEENAANIRLVYVDAIEFGGEHIRTFYETMADRFRAAYGEELERRRAAGEIGAPDPMVGVMVAVRWFFYFFTIEKCFGVPMHFGMRPAEATDEFIRLIRYGILPRPGNGGGEGAIEATGEDGTGATGGPTPGTGGDTALGR